MSEPPQAERAEGMQATDDGELVDALPVLASEPTIVPARPPDVALARSGAVVPVVQAAAVAVGGFVAGAAVVGLAQRRHRRSTAVSRSARRGRAAGRGGRTSAVGGELVQIVTSRSLLLDVHLLGPAPGER